MLSSSSKKFIFQVMLILVSTALSFSIFSLHSTTKKSTDSFAYVRIAAKQASRVMHPFHNRVLAPTLARYFTREGSTLRSGFIRLGMITACALGMVYAVFVLRVTSASSTLALVFTLFLYLQNWYWSVLAQIYLPEALNTLLILVFVFGLLTLETSRTGRLIPIVLCACAFLMVLSRESSVLFLLVVIAVSALTRNFFTAGATAFGLIAGSAVMHYITHASPAGPSGLTGLSYLVSKAVWNLPNNLLGFNLSSNVYNPDALPEHIYYLPEGLRFGNILWVGMENPDPAAAVKHWATLLTAFGVLPLWTIVTWYRQYSHESGMAAPTGQTLNARKNKTCRLLHAARSSPAWLSVSVVYGTFCFIIAPALGPLGFRLLSYAWPLLLALPVLYAGSDRSFVLLLVMALSVSFSFLDTSTPSLVAAFIAWTYTGAVLYRNRPSRLRL